MPGFAINHMTSPASSFEELLSLAVDNGCIGVEVRNDLALPMFSGIDAKRAGAVAKQKGIRLLGLAQLNEFNCWSVDKKQEAQQLIQLAVDSGAEAICLIPRNDGNDCDQIQRLANLNLVIEELAPTLRSAGLIGLIEPLGFTTASLRDKAEIVEVIDQLKVGDCFQLVHDTFHHFLAGGGPVFPDHTGIVHISGVIDNSVSTGELTDAHRCLVDSRDLLDNVGQIKALISGGFTGPISMEVFAPEVHAHPDLAARLGASLDFIKSELIDS